MANQSLLARRGILAALIALGMTGCMSTTTPQWDKNFGQALAQVNSAQILDPEPVHNHSDKQSTDAAAMVRVQTQYLHSFESPPQTQPGPIR